MIFLAMLGGVIIAGFTALGVVTYFTPNKTTTKRRQK